MKKILFMIVVALASVTMASAATLCTALIGQSILGQECEVDGLLFSNFAVPYSSGVGTPRVDLAAVNLTGSTVNLTFNPWLDATNGNQDMYFTFMVTGGLIGIDLTNGGTGLTSIGEVACAQPLVNFACPESPLATMTAGSQQHRSVLFEAPVSQAWIFKDIMALDDVETPGHLSSFTQSFETPEPMTFVLIGSGMLALGLVRKRRARN